MGLSASSRRRHLEECQLRERAVLFRAAVARIEAHPEQWDHEGGREMAALHYRFMLRLEQCRKAGDLDPTLVAEAEGLLARATDAVEAAVAWKRAATGAKVEGP